MKNCEYYQMLLSNLIDDKLPIKSNSEIQSHLNDCCDCKSFYQSVKEQTSLFESLPEIPYQLKLPQPTKAKWYQQKIILTFSKAAALVLFFSAWSVINLYQSFSGKTNLVEPPTITIEEFETVQTINFSPQPALLVSSSPASDNSQTNEEESL